MRKCLTTKTLASDRFLIYRFARACAAKPPAALGISPLNPSSGISSWSNPSMNKDWLRSDLKKCDEYLVNSRIGLYITAIMQTANTNKPMCVDSNPRTWVSGLV